MAFPARGHVDSIRDQLGDTRELLEIAGQSVVVDFDTAQSGLGWSERERVIDGNLSSWCENALDRNDAISSCRFKSHLMEEVDARRWRNANRNGARLVRQKREKNNLSGNHIHVLNRGPAGVRNPVDKL